MYIYNLVEWSGNYNDSSNYELVCEKEYSNEEFKKLVKSVMKKLKQDGYFRVKDICKALCDDYNFKELFFDAELIIDEGKFIKI